MNKYFKYTLLTLGIALVNGFVSWAVVRTTLRRAASSDSPYTAILQNYPGSENDYGSLQSGYELTSSRTVDGAPDLTPAAKLTVQAVIHVKVKEEQTIDYVDPFEFFLGDGRGFDRPQPRTIISFGSGVIISSLIYIFEPTRPAT